MSTCLGFHHAVETFIGAVDTDGILHFLYKGFVDTKASLFLVNSSFNDGDMKSVICLVTSLFGLLFIQSVQSASTTGDKAAPATRSGYWDYFLNWMYGKIVTKSKYNQAKAPLKNFRPEQFHYLIR